MLMDIRSLSDLAKVENGVLDHLFADGLAAAINDCRERPAEAKARDICFKVKLTPVADSQSGGALCEIKAEFELKTNVPVSRTRKLSMAAKGSGLVYNDLSGDSVHQGTLPIESGASS